MTAREKLSLFLRSLPLQAAFGPERMQGLGFAWALDPWLVKVWGHDAHALAEARKRHLAAFNTSPYAVGFVLGLVARLEQDAAEVPASERPARVARLLQLKAATSTGLAGAADAFFWGALRPALALAAILAGLLFYRFGLRAWAVLPALLYAAAWNAPALAARWRGIGKGFAGGESGIIAVCQLPAARAALDLRLAGIGLGLAAVMSALYSTALHENARLLGGVAILLAAVVPDRVGPWGVACGVGAVRALWEAGL